MAKTLITQPANFDFRAIAMSAGSVIGPRFDPTVLDGSQGFLVVVDVSQAALDAAIAAFNVTAYQQAKTAAATRRSDIVNDPLRSGLLNQLNTSTAAQISTFVDNNVTDIASAKTMFKRILLMIALDVRSG